MALKRLLTAEDFEKLSAPFKPEYKKSEDGSYVLDLTDYEDPGALKRAKDHEKEQRKTAEKKVKDLEDERTALIEERDGLLKGAIPKGDVEKLEGSYKKKLADKDAELTGKITKLTASLQKTLVDNVATTTAAKLFVSPTVGMPHIKSRLAVEQAENGDYVTRVLDKDGKPSALTVAELEKEFVDNPDFAPLLIGSKGAGGGDHGGTGGGRSNTGKAIVFTGRSPKDIASQLEKSGKLQERE